MLPDAGCKGRLAEAVAERGFADALWDAVTKEDIVFLPAGLPAAKTAFGARSGAATS